MSDIAAEMLKDMLNDIERNAYDGIDFRQDITVAYALADELGNERDQLKAENNKLRELVRDYDKCLDTALMLAREAGYPVMPDQGLFDSLRPRMRELGVKVE